MKSATLRSRLLILGAVLVLLISCQPIRNTTQSGPMQPTPKTPLEVVRAFNAAMEKMDFETALNLVSPQCEYTNGSLGTVYGPEGIRQALQPFFSMMLENELIILRESSQDGVVFMERLDRHRMESGWIELPVTGVYEVQDGRITVYHDYFDLGTLMRQMPK
jgi:limonene-1,2-epoxide hydrolase